MSLLDSCLVYRDEDSWFRKQFGGKMGFLTIVLLLCALPTFTFCASVGLDLNAYPTGTVEVNENAKNFTIALLLSESVQGFMVRVSCEQISITAGVTSVLLFNATVKVGFQRVAINASVVSPGRISEAECKGASLNGGWQYHTRNSTGKRFHILVTRGPTASICDSQVLVKEYVQGLQYFRVRLSEAVTSFPVVIDCVASNITEGAKSMQLEFSRVTVQISQNEVQVPYRLLSSGVSVLVSCRAQSSNCLKSSDSSPEASKASPFSSLVVTSSAHQILSATFSPSMLVSSNISSVLLSNISTVISKPVISNVVKLTLSTTPSTVIRLSSSSKVMSTQLSSIVQMSYKTSVFSPRNTTVVPLSLLSANKSMNLSNLTLTPVAISSSISALSSIPTTVSAKPTMVPINPRLNLSTCQYYFDTSLGPAVRFTLESSSIRSIPSHATLNSLRKHVNLIVLETGLPSTDTLELNCRMRSINLNQVVVSNACNSTSGIPMVGGTQVQLTETTISLLETKITFKNSEHLKNVTLVVNSAGNATDRKLLQTICCARGSPKYQRQSLQFLLWVTIDGTDAFEWASVPGAPILTPVTSLDTQCPCNIRHTLCDVNCCCDKDCSSLEIAAFTCTQGPFGGRQAHHFEFSCTATWPDAKDWQPVLCVVKNNSPFLGYFYPYTTPPIVSDIVPFENLMKAKTEQGISSYFESENRRVNVANRQGYDYGSPVKTTIGILSVPALPFGSTCLLSSVRYLFDKSTTCMRRAEESLCNKFELNALNYVIPSGLIYPSCPFSPGILAENTGTKLVAVNVEYYCHPTSVNYIISGDLTETLTNSSLFENDKEEGQVLPIRCAFDDGRTSPPRPTLNRVNNSCDNAVVALSYNLRWNATTLKLVNVKVTLGSIPMPTIKETTQSYTLRYTTTIIASSLPSVPTLSSASSFTSPLQSFTSVVSLMTQSVASMPLATVITRSVVAVNTSYISRNVTISPTLVQRFTISYQHESSVVAKSSVLMASSSMVVKASIGSSKRTNIRSGNPGYVLGRPILAQTAQEIAASVYSTSGLSVWKAKQDGTCSRFSTKSIAFGKDIVAGCNVRVYLGDMGNCTTLRKTIYEAQRGLVNAVRVAKRGNPVATVSDDWLNIISTQPNLNETRISNAGECLSIPAHVRLEILISEAGKYAGKSQHEVSGVRISYAADTWTFRCAPGAFATCFDRSKARENGLSNQWQEFIITSTVRFITIPARAPVPQKRSATVDRVCKYDSCLRELFFPFQFLYGHSIAFVSDLYPPASMLPIGLSLVLVGIGTLAVSQRWT